MSRIASLHASHDSDNLILEHIVASSCDAMSLPNGMAGIAAGLLSVERTTDMQCLPMRGVFVCLVFVRVVYEERGVILPGAQGRTSTKPRARVVNARGGSRGRQPRLAGPLPDEADMAQRRLRGASRAGPPVTWTWRSAGCAVSPR